MPKSLTLGNGHILVGFDNRGQVYDFYFPYVGLENQIGATYFHRIGIFSDGKMYWFNDPSWEISVECDQETLASNIKAFNSKIGLQVTCNDVVYNEKNILIRKIKIQNLTDEEKTIKVFFGHEFELYESHRGDTAYFDPDENVLIHYKGRRVFLINARVGEQGFDDYSVGLFEIEGKEGTHKDAEDGQLSKNPIEHGLVDSVGSVSCTLAPKEEKIVHYWVAVSRYMQEVYALNDYVLQKTPEYLIKSTKAFWRAWANKQNFTFYELDEKIINLFKKSVLLIRSHVDDNGAIIASGDSDMLKGGRDTYSYMWPRDGALTAIALNKAGYTTVAKKFFTFCNEVITPEGYFMHKYRSDKSLGSSWHPWVRNGKAELPIQEDEVALVIWALWDYYTYSKDLEFIEDLYNSLIKKGANFMVGHVYEESGLPKPSYDLWEEKFGVHTFTCATVYGALIAAAKFAKLLGKTSDKDKFTLSAQKIRKAILEHLYDEQGGYFYKMVNMDAEGNFHIDHTIDTSSVYGIFKFGVLDGADARVRRAVDAVTKKLSCEKCVGGIPRYEGDKYYRTHSDVAGNPWFITTLWMAQYDIAQAKGEKDLTIAKQWMRWVTEYALPSGVLSEQLDPYSGEQLSAAPLTWSHAEFVVTVIEYLEKLEEFGVCQVCNPIM